MRDVFGENSTIDVYRISWGNMDETILSALEDNYQGVSIIQSAVTKEQIRIANQKGFKVQIWTPRSKKQFDQCVLKKPQYIQSDYFN